jgi:hypothetical protein
VTRGMGRGTRIPVQNILLEVHDCPSVGKGYSLQWAAGVEARVEARCDVTCP